MSPQTATAPNWDARVGPCSTSSPTRAEPWHGTGFLYVRDRTFDAQSAYVTSQPYEQQRQFGGTVSGPLVKNRVFLYLGYDQHQLTIPAIVQFGNGASSVVPQPTDYDRKDHDLVFAAADQLNSLAGEYPVQMGGNAGFAKVDFNLSSETAALLPLEHVALLRHEQRIFRPG